MKLNARGKVFIEYLPAERAWVPIEAEGYTFVNCLWVSGSFKGHVTGVLGEGKGIDIFYTAQCPFTVPYVKMLQPFIEATDYPVRLHRITTREMAQAHVVPVTTYSVSVDGNYYFHEILTPGETGKVTCYPLKRFNG